MRRKNLRIKHLSDNLVDANYIASFLGISLNALYLRMHFDNFPKAIKVNGKLFFDLNLVLGHIQGNKDDKAYCYLVQDEIRSFIDFGKLTRYQVGQILNSPSPSVAGGAVYLRMLGLDRAKTLHNELEMCGLKLEISNDKSYYEQQNERLEYSAKVWESICSWVDTSKLDVIEIAKWINPNEGKRMGQCFYKLGPSYKVSKVIKLKALHKGLL